VRSIGVGEILKIGAQQSGQPVEEFATHELQLDLRNAVAKAYACGDDDLASIAADFALDVVTCWPDPEGAPLVGQRSVELLLARNRARITADPRATVLQLTEAARRPAERGRLHAWLVRAVTREPAPRRKGDPRPQSQRLFGPRSLQPIEIAIGLAHPITAIPGDLCARALPKLDRVRSRSAARC
jgi:hypothetical protein